jgi:AAA15 family ATPase/GTPase
MIISFSVANYRSIKEEQTLDFTAGGSGAKNDNVIQLDNLRLLKSIVLYGANASGKTNLIRAFFSFQFFVLNSIDLKRVILYPIFIMIRICWTRLLKTCPLFLKSSLLRTTRNATSTRSDSTKIV